MDITIIYNQIDTDADTNNSETEMYDSDCCSPDEYIRYYEQEWLKQFDEESEIIFDDLEIKKTGRVFMKITLKMGWDMGRSPSNFFLFFVLYIQNDF